MTEPSLVEDSGRYVPTLRSRGPWSGDSLHGRVLAGLFALMRVSGFEGPLYTIGGAR